MNKDLTKKLASGHSTCAGCGIPAIVRTVLGAIDRPVVVVNATGCLEVTTTIYPYTAWKVPYIHSAFENAGATVSGIETAYRVLMKRNFKTNRGKKIKFIVFGGDGGTYDIGLQSFSGAMERGHDFLYICYDNEGYMNTGGQRSGATPYGAETQTTPASEDDIGNDLERKDLMKIVAAHGVKYLAQANVAYLEDLKQKVKKAVAVEGPSFLVVLQPCTNEWKFASSDYVRYGRLATETNFWPLYEIENGNYKINHIPKEKKPVEEFLKGQGRFKHLFTKKNKKIIDYIKKRIEENWNKLLEKSQIS